MLNEYDELLQGKSGAVANEYDAIVKSTAASDQTALRGAMQVAGSTTPDRAAQVIKLSDRTKLPREIVERNFDALSKTHAVDENDYESLIRENPKLSAWLSDPANASVAADDVPLLRRIENTLTSFGGGWSKADKQGRLADLLYHEVEGGDLLPQDAAERDALKKRIQALSAEPGGVPEYIAGVTGYSARQMLSSMEVGAKGAGAGGIAGAAAGSVLPGVGTVAGGAAGMVAGGLVASAHYSYRMETAFAFDEFRSMLDVNGNPLDPQIARSAARGVGMVNSIIESGSDALLVSLVPGVGNIIGKAVGKDVAKQQVMRAVRDALATPTRRAMMLSALGKMGAAASTEGLEEFLQSLVGATGREAAQSATGQTFAPDNVIDDIDQAAREATDAFVGTFFTFAPVGGASYYVDARKAAKAQDQARFFEALGQGVAESKTFQRLPEKMQDMVAAATKDGPIETVYVAPEVWSTYWQSQGLDPKAVADEVMGETTLYEDSIRTGADMAIPMAIYATRIAPTKHNAFFANEMRLDPDGWNAREAAEFERKIAEERDAEQAAGGAQQSAIDQSVDAVRQDVIGQLIGSGYSQADAETNAETQAALFRSLGARSGVDPFQLYQQYGLKISRPLPDILKKRANADDLDATLDRLRAGTIPDEKQVYGKSLVELLRERGGLVDEGGELAARDADKGLKPFQRRLAQPGGMSLDTAREMAAQRGYIGQDSTVAEFLDLIDQELSGSPVYAMGAEKPEMAAIANSAMQLDSYLREIGVDLNSMTNDQVREAIRANTGLDMDAAAVMSQENLPATVEVDGVQRPTRNSNDQQITATMESMIAFWRWFGDSKVVDEQGRPLVVYHGTADDIAEFDLQHPNRKDTGWLGTGVYMTTSESLAGSYSLTKGGAAEANVMPLYARIVNPYYAEKDEKHRIMLLSHNNKQRGLDAADARTKELSAAGHDGIILKFTADQVGEANVSQEIVVFDNAGVKSATGNRGTFDPLSGNVLYQDEQPRLSTLHNLSAENLIFADEMGGLAAPSIAVVTGDKGMSGFGEITLIGRQELGDPNSEPVFDADVYTARHPSPVYKKVPQKKAQALVDAFRAMAKEFDDRGAIDTIWDNAVNKPDPHKSISDLLRRRSAMALFLSEVKGTNVEPVMREVKPYFPWIKTIADKDAFLELLRKVEDNEPGLRSQGPDAERLFAMMFDAANRYLETTDEGETLVAEFGEEKARAIISHNFGIAGEWINGVRDPRYPNDRSLYPYSALYRILESIRDLGKREVDTRASDDLLKEKLAGSEGEFKQWVERKILPMYGEPMIKVNGKNQPYTLENIVAAMIGGRVNNKEKTMTFGEGAARAAAATQFSDLEQMRKFAAENIVSDDEVSAAREHAKKLLETFRDELVEKYYGNRDSSEFGRIWEGMDATMRALAKWATGAKTAANLARRLRAEGFRAPPSSLIEQGVEAGLAWLRAPVPYFEAKPQRAVALSEFAGAVVPAGTDAEVLEILDRNGIVYREYKRVATGSAQIAATIKLRQELADVGERVLFQPAYHGSPHSFDKFSLDAIGTGEGAQAFGWGLYFAENPGVAKNYQRKLSRYSTAAGSLYQVDIPDVAVANMLDWDRPLSAQSESVKAALRKTPVAPDESVWDKYTGEQFYDGEVSALVEMDGVSRTQARRRLSEELRSAGIPGIKYLDATSRDAPVDAQIRNVKGDKYWNTDRGFEWVIDAVMPDGSLDRDFMGYATRVEAEAQAAEYRKKKTRNLVVFDESIVNITHKDGSPLTAQERKEYLQGGDKDEKRGRIRFTADRRKFSIEMLAGADLSTFVHESGHFWLEVMGDIVATLSRADPATLTEQQIRMVDDYQKLLNWFGVKSRDEITVEHHERFARGIEAYFMEGNAPAPELRSAFAKIRAWMMAIYRSMKQLNVDLNPEVRSVFDRMFATDEQIAAAEQEANVEGMFLTAEAAGMKPEAFAAYKKQIEKASQVARETLGAKIMRTLTRERAAWWKSERSKVRDEVAAEVAAMPEQIALSVLTRGKMPDGSDMPDGVAPFKLNRKEIDSVYGDGAWKTLPRGATAADGIALSTAAEVLGYESGDALIRAVRAARPAKQLIEAETDVRMREAHGDPLLDGSIADDAKAAVHNEERAKVIEIELRALNKLRNGSAIAVREAKKDGRAQLAAVERERAYERRWLEAEKNLALAIERGAKQAEIDDLQAELRKIKSETRQGMAMLRSSASIPPLATISRIARGMIAQMKARDVRPGQYLAAARKASEAATLAAGERDYNRAVMNKQRELLNVELYRAATNAREEIDGIAEYMRKFGTPKVRARIAKAGQDYLDQIDGFLDRYEFAKVPLSALDRRASLALWIAQKEKAGEPVNLPDDVVVETRINYKDVTVDALRGIADSVRHIEHLARLKNKLLKARDQKELQQAIDEIVQSLRDNAKSVRGRRIETRLPSDEAARLADSWLAMHRKLSSMVREMDGIKDGGVLWEYLMRPINEAADVEAEMNRAATRKFAELFEAYKGKDMSALYVKERINEIGTSLTKMGRISIALNWGNLDSRQKVMDGYGWTEAQVEAVLNGLDERDWKFVSGVWEFIGSYWSEIEAKEKRVNGIAPERVEPVTVMTRFGEIPGGYYPLVYDDRQSAKAHGNRVKEVAEQMMKGAFTRSSTRRGHTKARVEGVKLPIRTDFGVMFEHVAQVIHDISHHEMLIDSNRLLGAKEVSGAIIEIYGDVTYKQMQAAIEDIAAGNIPAIGAFEKSINWVRTGMTVAGLGWNIMTSLLQPFGLAQSMVRVGPQWVGNGLARWLGDASRMENTAAWIRERSPMMRSRMDTQMREINEIRQQVGLNTGKLSGWVDQAMRTVTLDKVNKQAVTDSFFWLIYKGQQIADIPTWIGAYEKARAANNDEARSVALADQAVLDSQGGGQMKDLAGIQRGGPLLKIWTSFYSYFNVTYNLSVESVKRTQFSSPAQIGRLAVDFLLLYTLPATLAFLTKQALKGDEGPEDDEFWAKLLRENLSYMTGVMVGVREISSVVQGYQGYSGPAGARFFSAISGLVKQVEQGEFDSAFWKALNNAAGIVLHYPAGQVQRTVEGFVALQEGRTQNPLALLVGPPKE